MYWFNLQNPFAKRGFIFFMGLASVIVLLASCRPDVKETKGNLVYFDLKGFFKADSARLTAKHQQVTKTVMHNHVTQTKKVYINNWGRELELFTKSDINRPSWRGSYSISKSASAIIYEAKTPELKTRKIVIGKNGDKVKWILIFNHTRNLLYENTEKLSYFPDSLYQIDKLQHVRLMGNNLYSIKGQF